MAGDFDRALAAARDVSELVAGGGEGICEPELYRLIGEATSRCDPKALAEASKSFRKAIEIARLQGTKSWELKSHHQSRPRTKSPRTDGTILCDS